MSDIILTSFKRGASHQSDATLTDPVATTPEVVFVPSAAIREKAPRRNKGFGTVVKTTLGGAASGLQYHVYESPDQIEAAILGATGNFYGEEVEDGISAAGSASGDSPTLLTKYLNRVEFVPDADDDAGVVLPAPSASRLCIVINAGTAAIDVYPHGASGTINGAASGVDEAIPAGERRHYCSDGGDEDGAWISAVVYN